MAKINPTPDFNKMIRTTLDKTMRKASVLGLNHFKDSFRNQGFTDSSLVPWKPIKQKLSPSRAILINSGHLRDSIQILDRNMRQITFGTYARYAEIHNEGGTINIRNTDKAKRYFWYMYKKTGQPHWKNMALSKKQVFTINMPKRQFIGESAVLLHNIEDAYFNLIEQQFKKAFK